MSPETNAFDAPEDRPGTAPGGLAAFDEQYEQTEAPDFEDVPDGKYQVRVHQVHLGESQKGDPMLKWDLVIISGAGEGRHIFKNAVITAASLPFVKGDLKTLGLQLPRFSDLPAHLEQLLDKRLQVTKRTKDEFANVYFNKLLSIPEGGGLEGEPAPF